MECDVAVLGGGPAGYTAAIRAAQLGGKVVCIEQEPALGGTCLRVGCIPTKAWVQTAHALHDARETFAKLGVGVAEPQLDFTQAAAWKDGVVAQMTGGVAGLLQGERRRVGSGARAGSRARRRGQRGYSILTPPNGIPANAPNFSFFRTVVYFDPAQDGSKEGARRVAALFGAGRREAVVAGDPRACATARC